MIYNQRLILLINPVAAHETAAAAQPQSRVEVRGVRMGFQRAKLFGARGAGGVAKTFLPPSAEEI